jgi:hypothetical protein
VAREGRQPSPQNLGMTGENGEPDPTAVAVRVSRDATAKRDTPLPPTSRRLDRSWPAT